MQTSREPLTAATGRAASMRAVHRKCLLIDDSRFDRRILIRVAERAGLALSFVEAANLKTARVILQTDVIDLVIADYHLPDGSGVDLAQEVLEGALGAPAPLILMSGQGSEQIVADGFGAGCMAYLRKADLSDTALAEAVARSFASFAAGRTLSTRAAQRQHDPVSLQMSEVETKAARLFPLMQNMRRQLRGLRADLYTGDTDAALAQTTLLEEALEGLGDLSADLTRGAA